LSFTLSYNPRHCSWVERDITRDHIFQVVNMFLSVESREVPSRLEVNDPDHSPYSEVQKSTAKDQENLGRVEKRGSIGSSRMHHADKGERSSMAE